MAKLTKKGRRKSQMLESYKCGVSYSSLTQRKKACTSEREATPDDAGERASLNCMDHDDNDTSVGHGNKGDKCNSNDTSDSQGNKGDLKCYSDNTSEARNFTAFGGSLEDDRCE
jgi:hypothetical protein